jgi:tRNA (guanine-N7-)-methyltransferase
LRPSSPTEHATRISERRDTLRSTLATIIGSGARFVWEVGSGHGHFLTAFAAEHTDVSCVGIDIAEDRILRSERKRVRSRLTNLHFVRAAADDFLAAMPEGSRFLSVYVLFPDPWPKRRHHKNRVMTREFLSTVARLSVPGGPLFFRTDHEAYFLQAAATVRGHPDWAETEPASWPFEEPTVFQLKAERHFSLVALRR